MFYLSTFLHRLPFGLSFQPILASVLREFCHSARIRAHLPDNETLGLSKNLLNNVEYQKCPFKGRFYKIRAVFTQNVSTKLVLNCEININDARFLY